MSWEIFEPKILEKSKRKSFTILSQSHYFLSTNPIQMCVFCPSYNWILKSFASLWYSSLSAISKKKKEKKHYFPSLLFGCIGELCCMENYHINSANSFIAVQLFSHCSTNARCPMPAIRVCRCAPAKPTNTT